MSEDRNRCGHVDCQRILLGAAKHWTPSQGYVCVHCLFAHHGGNVSRNTREHERTFQGGILSDFGPYETFIEPWNVGPFDFFYKRIVSGRIARLKTVNLESYAEIY